MENAKLSTEQLVERLIEYTAEDSGVRIYQIENLVTEFVKRVGVTSEEQDKVMTHVIYRSDIAQEHIDNGFDAKGIKIFSDSQYMRATRARARAYGLLISKGLIK